MYYVSSYQPIKHAVKGLLRLPDERLVVVANHDGRWDLPGGSPKKSESNLKTFYRYVKNELGVQKQQLADLRRLPVIDTTTEMIGIPPSEWALFSGRLLLELADLAPPNGGDTSTISGMTVPEILDSDRFSKLTRLAVERYCQA